jgi:hypothetical protein
MTEVEQQRSLVLGSLVDKPEMLNKVLALEAEAKIIIEKFIEENDEEAAVAISLAFMAVADSIGY